MNTNAATPDALDLKIIEHFEGKVVRKDLLHRIKKGTNVPTFVLEFLLARFCASDDQAEMDSGMEAVLASLQEIEREFGRKPKKVLNEPRLLDLDLIAFASETRAGKELTLPHPRAHERRFVLQPLSEVAP